MTAPDSKTGARLSNPDLPQKALQYMEQRTLRFMPGKTGKVLVWRGWKFVSLDLKHTTNYYRTTVNKTPVLTLGAVILPAPLVQKGSWWQLKVIRPAFYLLGI